MIEIKLWRSVGAAALISVGAFIPSGCGQGQAPSEEGVAQQREAGQAAIGAAGGEQGEQGAAGAYAGLEGPARAALRLQHLKGFVLAARYLLEVGTQEEAGALVGQGLLEVYAPAQDQFAGFDAAPVSAAESAGLDGRPRREVAQKLDAATRAISAAQAPLDADAAVLCTRMLDISTGLYAGVVQNDIVDPIEYQHSLGAALAAREALIAGEDALRARNSARYEEALREVNRFVELWPQPTAPERPTSNRDVLAQASRVKLALSTFL